MAIDEIRPPVHRHPAELLQNLIRFDTTNPPGHTEACIAYIRQILDQADIPSQTFAKAPQQPNLVARLRGAGNAPPLLLYGHVDVVTTENQHWTHPPFDGKLIDGFIWGRGALDMKGGLAMLLAAFLRAKAEKARLPGDVIFLALSDEENGGDLGARFMVEEHPEIFDGIRYALGEFGGFTLQVGNQRFRPIQVSEKQRCQLKITFTGQGGHGSMPVRRGAIAKLAAFLQKIDRRRLPVHITPTARAMIASMATAMGGVQGLVMQQLLNPPLTNFILNRLGPQGQIFDALLHNTVSPTILHASQKVNVIPSQVSVELDGRLLPGFTPADLIAELQHLAGPDLQIEVVHYDPGPEKVDMTLYPVLADILHELDPQSIPVPLLLSGITDGRFLARLGIQTYGFLPMTLPDSFNFVQTIHSADERIPAAALDEGTEAIYRALQRFGVEA